MVAGTVKQRSSFGDADDIVVASSPPTLHLEERRKSNV
jgi:hypothetical protein